MTATSAPAPAAPARTPGPVEPAPPRRTSARRRREQVAGLLLLLPAVAGLGTFVVWPMIDAVRLSFLDRRLTSREAPFEGLGNWASVLADPAFAGSLWFTAVFTATTVTGAVVLALLVALAAMDRPLVGRAVSALVVLPTATSLVVAAIGWRFVFDLRGTLNRVLDIIGLDRVNWLNDPTTARMVLIAVSVWGMAGFALLLYQAALSRVPRSLVETARVFGRWRGARNKLRLVAPLVGRTTVVAVVVSTIVTLRTFDQILAMTEGGPDGSTENLAYLAWQRSFRFYDLGEGAVASVVLTVLVLTVATIQLLLLRRLAGKGTVA